MTRGTTSPYGGRLKLTPLVQGGGAGVRDRLRRTFSSAQRLARASVAATVLGGWDAALRVGLGSRRPAGVVSVLRGAGGI